MNASDDQIAINSALEEGYTRGEEADSALSTMVERLMDEIDAYGDLTLEIPMREAAIVGFLQGFLQKVVTRGVFQLDPLFDDLVEVIDEMQDQVTGALDEQAEGESVSDEPVPNEEIEQTLEEAYQETKLGGYQIHVDVADVTVVVNERGVVYVGFETVDTFSIRRALDGPEVEQAYVSWLIDFRRILKLADDLTTKWAEQSKDACVRVMEAERYLSASEVFVYPKDIFLEDSAHTNPDPAAGEAVSGSWELTVRHIEHTKGPAEQMPCCAVLLLVDSENRLVTQFNAYCIPTDDMDEDCRRLEAFIQSFYAKAGVQATGRRVEAMSMCHVHGMLEPSAVAMAAVNKRLS